MAADAAKVFAFDSLIQNPDRRPEKPNLFTSGDDLYVYDHESGFSFLLVIGGTERPWILEKEKYLENHVFYSRLRAKTIDLGDFKEKLVALTDSVLAKIRKDVPQEWLHDNLNRIELHLTEVRNHADEFVEQVMRRLV